MSRVLVTVPVPGPALDLLRDAPEVDELVVCEEQPDRDRLREMLASGEWDVVLSQLTDDLRGEQLREARVTGICNYAVGHDNVDLDVARERGILVGNTPGVLTDATADVAMLLVLGTRRRAAEGDALVRRGGFTGWGPDFLLGRDVTGAVLGLVGRGRIAQSVARRAAGFEMDVRYCTVRPGDDGERDHPMDALARRVSFDEVVEESDVVSLHVPLAEGTRHLVDAAVLQRMKPTAVLVNTARGPVVDEAALVEALNDGVIAGAGLDVYEDEPRLAPGLAEAPGTLLLPHVGSATESVRAAMGRCCAENALAMLRGERPPYLVEA